MNSKCFERRRYLLKELNSGRKLSTIVKETAINYRCTTRTVYRDIESKTEWMPEVFGISDKEAFFLDCLSRYEDLMRLSREGFYEASGTAKIGFLRCMIELTDRLVNMGIAYDLRKRVGQLENLLWKD